MITEQTVQAHISKDVFPLVGGVYSLAVLANTHFGPTLLSDYRITLSEPRMDVQIQDARVEYVRVTGDGLSAYRGQGFIAGIIDSMRRGAELAAIDAGVRKPITSGSMRVTLPGEPTLVDVAILTRNLNEIVSGLGADLLHCAELRRKYSGQTLEQQILAYRLNRRRE